MAALSEEDRKLILGDKYVAQSAALKIAANAPRPVSAFLRKLFSK